jgi:hypothetical protein
MLNTGPNSRVPESGDGIDRDVLGIIIGVVAFVVVAAVEVVFYVNI